VAGLAAESLLTLVVVGAVVVLAAAFLHTTGMERRFWAFGCVGAFFLLVGRVHDLVIATFSLLGIPVAGLWSGLFNVAAVISLLALLLAFSRFRHASLAARLRYVIDIAAVSLVMTGAIEALIIGPWFDRLDIESVWLRVVYAASPVVGALAAAGVAMIFMNTHVDRWEPWERLLACAFGALAVSLVVAPAAYVDAVRNVGGGWVHAVNDIVWMSGVYLGLAGAVWRHLGAEHAWHLRPLATLEPSYGWFPSVVLPSIEFLSLPLLGIAAAEAAEPAVRMLRLVVVGAIALTIAVRTLLTVMDTEALTAGVVTDSLTSLYNHRHFQTLLDQEVAYAARYGECVSLVELDLDDFTAVNASFGHAAGDKMLVALARAAVGAVRTCDIVCRSGGDEIAIVLPSTDPDTAAAVAARVVAEMRRVPAPNGRRVTASAGVASLPGQAGERSELVGAADAALYWAKTHGKDRAMLYDPETMFAAGGEERVRDLLQRADNATVRALAAAVDARDEETQDHSRNVARYAVAVARELGLDDRSTRLIEYAGLLHDVGKIGVPDAILRKTGPLTPAERARMQEHVILGEAILASTTMQEILPWVRYHHERWDGSGYPDGIEGEDIPLEARILALANAYDAMRSNRPYRAGLSRSAALQEIDLGLGTVFDPVVGEVFIDSIGRTYL
jgi:diguanylate cyclase (GGDEF)-like protein/putative nucleotidyltransferase with HDIG domain